jgi:hypothetical protein
MLMAAWLWFSPGGATFGVLANQNAIVYKPPHFSLGGCSRPGALRHNEDELEKH